MRGLAVAALLLFWGSVARAESSGLRWSGDARVGATTTGAFGIGPAVHFRYGGRFAARPSEFSDRVFGSWLGVELSGGVLAGMPIAERYGAAVLVGAKPWLSRAQGDWFLRNERWSVLGLLLPEAGVCFGFERAHWYLGWDMPLGDEEFQIAPGIVWLAPGKREPLVFTLAFRVPM